MISFLFYAWECSLCDDSKHLYFGFSIKTHFSRQFLVIRKRKTLIFSFSLPIILNVTRIITCVENKSETRRKIIVFLQNINFNFFSKMTKTLTVSMTVLSPGWRRHIQFRVKVFFIISLIFYLDVIWDSNYCWKACEIKLRWTVFFMRDDWLWPKTR